MNLTEKIQEIVRVESEYATGRVHSNIMREVERTVIEEALKQNQYNTSKTSRVLGISRGTMTAKLKQYFNNQYVKGE